MARPLDMNWIDIEDMTRRQLDHCLQWLLRRRKASCVAAKPTYSYDVVGRNKVREMLAGREEGDLAALPDSPSESTPSRAEVLAENGVHEVELPHGLVVKSVDRDAGTISVGPGKATEFEQCDSISIVTEDPEYIIDGETVRASELDLSAPDGYFWAVVRCGDGGASFELVHGDHVVGGVDEWSCGAWRYCVDGVEGEASTYRMAMTSAAAMVCRQVLGTEPTLRQDIGIAAKNDAVRRIIRGLGEHMHFVLWHSRENARTCVMTGSTFVQVRHEARGGVSNPWTWTGGDTFSMDNGHPYESPEWLLLIDLIVANHIWARDDK